MLELLIRFLLGPVVVSAFALPGDVVKPRSLAGLFSAAPSVALATLSLAIAQHGRAYVSEQARSMMLGALAFGLYACLVCRQCRSCCRSLCIMHDYRIADSRAEFVEPKSYPRGRVDLDS